MGGKSSREKLRKMDVEGQRMKMETCRKKCQDEENVRRIMKAEEERKINIEMERRKTICGGWTCDYFPNLNRLSQFQKKL